jgi:hypothetical protein
MKAGKNKHLFSLTHKMKGLLVEKRGQNGSP